VLALCSVNWQTILHSLMRRQPQSRPCQRVEREERLMNWKDGDRVVTAWAESASGPGWANQLVWVLVRDRMGALRIKALQPREQTSDMRAIYGYSAMATRDMVMAVEAKLCKSPRAKEADNG